MPDGQRFVMLSANVQGTDEGLAVILVTNWFEELRQRMGNRRLRFPGFASSWKAWTGHGSIAKSAIQLRSLVANVA